MSTKNKAKLNIKSFLPKKSVFYLLTVYSWRSFYWLAFLILLPLFIWIFSELAWIKVQDMLNLISKYEESFTPSQYLAMQFNIYQYFRSLLIVVVISPIALINISLLPLIVCYINQSVLAKKIGISNGTNKFNYMLTIFLFFFLFNIIIIFYVFFWLWILNVGDPEKLGLIFGGSNAFSYGVWELSTNWGQLIMALLYQTIFSITLGLLLVMIIKKNIVVQCISSIIFVMSLLLSGVFFDTGTINQNMAIRVISYIIPFRYTMGLVNIAWLDMDIFSMTSKILYLPIDGNHKMPAYTLYYNYDMYLNWFIPLVVIGIGTYTNIKLVNFSGK